MRRARTNVALLSLLFLLLPVSGRAQERSGDVLKRLDRKELSPDRRDPTVPLIETEEIPKKRAVPENGVVILVNRFVVEGVTLIGAEEITRITGPLEGSELSLETITGVAESITQTYRRLGYILAYAYVPPQDVRNGVVTIRVLEGTVGKVAVMGNVHYDTDFIRKHIEKTKEDASLKADALEKAILILNELPSLEVRTSLRAGEKPGTSDILVKAADSRHIKGAVHYDNAGSRTISKHRVRTELELGGIAREGDLALITGTTGIDRIDFDRLLFGKLEYSTPVNCSGTRLGIYLTNNVYEVGESLAPLRIDGKARVGGVYLSHPLKKRTNEDLSLRLGFEYKDVFDYMLDEGRSKDNIRSVNFGVRYGCADSLSGRNVLSLTCHLGIPGILGGNESDDPGTSRIGADGEFHRLALDFRRIQRVAGNCHLVVRASGQLSADALFAAEQLAIGGVGMVRGFKPSIHSGDSGYLVTAETHLPCPTPDTWALGEQKLKDTLTFVLFADHGGVYRNDLQAGESRDEHLTSVGAGIRLRARERVSLGLDWAVPWNDGSLDTNDTTVYVQATASF